MPRPKTVTTCKHLCSGCRSDRYNHKGTCERSGIDAPVTSDNCWSLDIKSVLYCRAKKTYVMPCHSEPYQQWLAQWARDNKEPNWKYY